MSITKSGGSKPKTGGSTVPSKQKIYAKIAMQSTELVDGLFKLTKSKNENIALGARKVLINKIIPDLRSTEVSGEVGMYRITVDRVLEIPDGNTKVIHTTPKPKGNTLIKG